VTGSGRSGRTLPKIIDDFSYGGMHHGFALRAGAHR
jgi:hypothetical protein